MKILTKEEEQRHYNATVRGGTLGGVLGTAAGMLGVWAGSKRSSILRSTTLPFKAFLIGSVGTFTAIIFADRASRNYDLEINPEKRRFIEEERQRARELTASKTSWQLAKEWGEKNRYSIVFASWVASMGIALGIVNRNPYLTGAQKLVQARVYAQGLTLGLLLASFALEANDANKGKGRWETVKVIDPNDPTHKHMVEKKVHIERYAGEDQWRDMVEAEEERLKAREQAVKEEEEKDRAAKSKK